MKRLLRRLFGRLASGAGELPGLATTTEHVRWGYRLFLDREAENAEVVADKARLYPNSKALRLDFMASYEFRRSNPELGYLTERTVLIKELDDGRRLYVDLADRVIGLAIARDVFEPDEAAFVRAVVRPGDNVLDIGANIGFFTVLLGAAVGPSGRVCAFEPLPENVDLLERSIVENGFAERVRLERAAVGAADGTARLVVVPQSGTSGGSYLDSGGAALPAGHVVEEVPVVALDRLDLPRPIAFVKIDVEGAELLALRGGQRLLRDDRPVILSEINTRQLGIVSGCTPAEFVAEIEALGYECRLLAAGGELVRDQADPNREGVRSVVFLPVEPGG